MNILHPTATAARQRTTNSSRMRVGIVRRLVSCGKISERSDSPGFLVAHAIQSGVGTPCGCRHALPRPGGKGLLAVLLGLAVVISTAAESPPSEPVPKFWRWAERPPMGWNSWDCFATTVTEAQTKAQADYLARYLQPHGWEYIVVDIQWYEPNAQSFEYRKNAQLAMDEFGRLWPATNRFPSSVGGVGFKALADYVHGKGLKFGIHLMRGIPRQAVRENTRVKGTNFRARDVANTNSICDWNPDMFGVDMTRPGAQDYYNSVFDLIASWGVDYVKVDDLSRPYHTNRLEVEAIRRAIDQTGRPMVLSLSPGETALSAAEHVKRHANLWRISDDFWDSWPALYEQFERLRNWNPHRGPGHWPDADMLPLGVLDLGRRTTRFTPDEQHTLMTLWCIARSPLMHGGDMTKMDDFTLSLLTNDEVLAVNQRSSGNRELFHRGSHIAWVADVPDSADKYLAVFNAPGPMKVQEERAAFNSGLITRHTPGYGTNIDLEISGARSLVLVIAEGDGDIFGDHADWIEPRLVVDGQDRKLIELPWASASTGWGGLNIGQTAGGKPITLNGKGYPDAIGAHSLSVIEYELPEGATRFKALAALDDAAVAHPRGATVKFLVFTNAAAPASRKEPVPVSLAELGFGGKVRVRDLWRHTDLGEFQGEFAPEIPPHGAGLYRVSGGRLPKMSGDGERLDRGVVAFLQNDGSAYIGWRLLASDPATVAFDVFRSGASAGESSKLNAAPIGDSCNFVDATAGGKAWYYSVRPVGVGDHPPQSAPARAESVLGETAFRRLKLQGNYLFDKVGIADLDGDGALDFVIKQPNQISDPGVWRKSEETFKLEAYASNGSFLWRKDLGWNIEQGVWWSPMIVYDFDGDGRAEVAVKTAPTDADHRDAEGKVTTGPEWCSVLDGVTGREIARVDWPARGKIADWGDPRNNRASRHLMGLAYLDGKRASLLAMRGTYTKMVVDAYNLVDGRLVPVWKWCGDNEQPPVRGQGMHGMHAVDVDGDGRDEIVLGAAVLDDNGKILWNLGMGHPDAVYVSDILPERPGLEIIYGFETKQERNGFCLVEAETGKLIWGCDHPTTHIHSQGLFGDFDPANPGPEFYDGEKFGPERWTYSARDGRLLAREDLGGLAPIAVYWADGPLKMIAARGRIRAYRGAQLDHYEGRVVAVGDLLGDWREELVTSVAGELRIYSTTIPATTRRTCLLQDRAYRTDVALAAMGYLYPPQVAVAPTAFGAGR